MTKNNLPQISGNAIAEIKVFKERVLEDVQRLHMSAFGARFAEVIDNSEWLQLHAAAQISDLLDYEVCKRNANAKAKLKRAANLTTALQDASFEKITRGGTRQMDERILALVSAGGWILDHPHDLILTGPCGVGKSYIAAAAVNFAIEHGKSAYFVRSGRLMEDLEVHRMNNSIGKRMKELSKIHLLVLDDFVLENMTERNCGDLLDLITQRVGCHPTIYTSQFEPNSWQGRIGDVPFAQAILDRIYHSSVRLKISGRSQREDVQPK